MLLSDSEGDSIQDDDSDPDGGIFDDVRCVHDYILHVVLSIVMM